MRKIIFFCFFAAFLSGCSFTSPEELDRLMKEDSVFRQMIAARDQTHAQIRLIKEDLLARKKLMDQQIDKLRGDYDAYAKAQNLKIEKARAAIDANRNLLKREIEVSSAQLESKSKELQSYYKTLADIKEVLKEKKDYRLSAQEKQKWQERAMMFTEKIRPLAEEIQELKLQTKLKKQKIGFLN